MSFQIIYHPAVRDDIAKINEKLKIHIRKAISTRLAIAPQQYGEPLRKTLKGYWKMRVGDYRIVFKIYGNEILILAILHRKTVYESIPKRL